MEKIEIAYSQEVETFLDELMIILFNDDYFSFEENAIEYVQKLVYFINQNLNLIPHKKSPKKLKKYGNFCIFYNSNARTTWYIFFVKKNEKYLVKHITNNHNFDANQFND